jgi:hypothetical protein
VIQKKRHLTTAPYYKPGDKFLIVLEPVSRILFYSSFIALLAWLFMWPYLLAAFGLRMICLVTVMAFSQKR